MGAIVVHRGNLSEVVDTAYGAQRIDENGSRRTTVSPEAVKKEFGETLAALPGHPARFTLYFLEDSDELTPRSQQELKRVFKELRKRPLPDITVTGHTDAVGTVKYNDQLSTQRAERMRDILVQMGLSADRITIAGRGKREPLVMTDKGQPEPRNRRVEIDVR